MEENRPDIEFLTNLIKSQLMEEGIGLTVVQKVKSYKQPKGGLIKGEDFQETSLGKGMEELYISENVNAGLVGLTVDYLSRFILSENLLEAFKISLLGATLIQKKDTAEDLLNKITGLDDESIESALKLTGFDVVYRAGYFNYKPIEEIQPDKKTLENIRIMVERSLVFFEQYGPVTKDGFTFEGAYTETIVDGDGDFLTEDTLWDMKTIKGEITPEHTLQLLIYWRMGLRSDLETFGKIKKLGIYNPRKNKVFEYDLADLPEKVKRTVDLEIIGYSELLGE